MIFFAPRPVGTDGCTAVFEALDGEDSLGTCRLRIDGTTADVFEIALTGGTAEIGEGLLRTAYNFAANKGAYWGICSAKNAEQIVCRLNFENCAGLPENDIPSLLSGSCRAFDKQG